jgi:hypothetical protein
MSKEKKSDNLPVNWEDQMAKAAKAIATVERPSVNKISMRGGILQIDDRPLTDNLFTCVIVGAVHEQVRFDEKWDPTKIVPPVCYAFSEKAAVKGEMAPDENVPDPVSLVCAGCSSRSFGEGGVKPKCQSRRRIAVVAWNSDNTLDDEIYTLSFPAYSSGKVYQAYASEVAISENRPPYGVITEVKLANHPKWQYILDFKNLGRVPDEEMVSVMGKVGAAVAALTTPYDMSGPVQEEAAPLKGST